MQREILFRGKRVDNGEWVYGYYAEITVPSLGLMIRTDSDETFAEDTKPYIIEVEVRQHPYFSNAEPYCIVENEYYEVIPETIGQYTGLKDKNGKEIYEGDIIDHFAVYGYVIFEDGMFTLNTSANNQFGNHKQPICYVDTTQCEAIGNTYENPELLEVSE